MQDRQETVFYISLCFKFTMLTLIILTCWF